MLQREGSRDFVIATGKSVFLEYFIEKTLSYHGSSGKNHLLINSSFLRPSDIKYGAADPCKTESILGCKAKYDVDDVILMMSIATQDIE